MATSLTLMLIHWSIHCWTTTTKVMTKDIHDAVYSVSNLKQQDIPKGIRQLQNHSEKDLIMKAIDIELQVFKDLDVYDTVSRKTIPRGTEIIS